MKTEKPIAIAYSDHHIHDWSAYSTERSRLKAGCSVFKILQEASKKYGNIPILFAGDLYHTPKVVSNETITQSILAYNKYIEDARKIQFYAISGNHDQSQRNVPDNPSSTYLKIYDAVFDSFHLLDESDPILHDDRLVIMGIPYLTSNTGFIDRLRYFEKYMLDHGNLNSANRTRILLIHTDLPGAVNSHEIKIESGENIPEDLDTFFNQFDWVLSGHIHVPQRLGKNVIMLGAFNQQTWGDQNVDMGYWLIYKNKYPKFIKSNFPEFIRLKPGEPIPDDYNFYATEAEKTQDTSSAKEFSKSLRPGKLAKRYLKANNHTNKEQRKFLINFLERQW